MRKYWPRIIVFTSVLFLCLLVSCNSEKTQTETAKTTVKQTSQPSLENENTASEESVQKAPADSQEQEVEKVKEDSQQAQAVVEDAKKEAEIQEKAVDLEKKRAEIKLKEAEVAKKEVEIVKETAKSKAEVKKAVEEAKQKEQEALAAQEKVRLAEEKMAAAQEKARIAEEELGLALEKTAVVEAKVKRQRNVIYKKLIQTGLIILIGYISIVALRRVVNTRIEDLKLRHLTRRNVGYVIKILIVLCIIFLWVQDIGAITIFLSVISAGVVLVLQDPILSMVGWLFILVRSPFEIGDRIELGGVKGDVMDIRLFQTSLLEIGNWVDADQSTGRIVNIPNSAVFKEANYNYSRGFEFIWNEIKILVTFESDWKRAEEIMLGHAQEQAKGMAEIVQRKIKEMTRHYMIRYGKLTPIVYVNIKDSGVELTLRYLTEARKRRTTQDVLCKAILDDFAKEEKVNFAYPTYRIVR
ncbi:MAG: mechanosensitive ion channel [Sedimentisphaerales bacterium]|nr:mechanosensitive ion channel [Sedimentisphaerales bacterium]